jgi:hypothetical protein
MHEVSILFIVTAIASTLAAAYGIYATVTDFHEKRDEKKVLSRSGKWGIAFLVLVSLFTISVDLWKEKKADEGGAEVAEKLARAIDPIDQQWRIMVTVEVDSKQPTVQRYVDRLERRYESSGDDSFIEFIPREPGFPNARAQGEKLVAELANFQGIALAFTKRGKPASISSSATTDDADFSLTGSCAISDVNKGRNFFKKIDYNGEGTDLNIECNTSEVLSRLTKEIRSYRDLEGANVLITLHMMATPSRETRRNEFEGINFNLFARIESRNGSRECQLQEIHAVPGEVDRRSGTAIVVSRSAMFRATATCD